MDAQKHLICTTNATIYQNECGVDAISFLLPLKYDELDIGECVVAIEYVDPMSVTHVEVLEKTQKYIEINIIDILLVLIAILRK